LKSSMARNEQQKKWRYIGKTLKHTPAWKLN